MEKAGRSMSNKEFHALHDYPWEDDVSIPGLWSWRGAIYKKYMGYMPTPEDMDLPADHPFFDPDYVCEGYRMNSKLECIAINFVHHGRKIRRNEKRWKTHVLPRIAELRANNQCTEGCTFNGSPL